MPFGLAPFVGTGFARHWMTLLPTLYDELMNTQSSPTTGARSCDRLVDPTAERMSEFDGARPGIED